MVGGRDAVDHDAAPRPALLEERRTPLGAGTFHCTSRDRVHAHGAVAPAALPQKKKIQGLMNKYFKREQISVRSVAFGLVATPASSQRVDTSSNPRPQASLA